VTLGPGCGTCLRTCSVEEIEEAVLTERAVLTAGLREASAFFEEAPGQRLVITGDPEC
jgi:hypothetical protein